MELDLPGELLFTVDADAIVAHADYEVVVSFPASMPTYFNFGWSCNDVGKGGMRGSEGERTRTPMAGHNSLRRLLNTEKTQFRTGGEKGLLRANSLESPMLSCWLSVAALPEGVSHVHPSGRTPRVQ